RHRALAPGPPRDQGRPGAVRHRSGGHADPLPHGRLCCREHDPLRRQADAARHRAEIGRMSLESEPVLPPEGERVPETAEAAAAMPEPDAEALAETAVEICDLAASAPRASVRMGYKSR